jgi:hypothetical protein
MDVGERVVNIADHMTLGPVQIEISQPLPSLNKRNPRSTEKSLEALIEEVQTTNAQILKIYELLCKETTRPCWLVRFFRWIKNVAFRR